MTQNPVSICMIPRSTLLSVYHNVVVTLKQLPKLPWYKRLILKSIGVSYSGLEYVPIGINRVAIERALDGQCQECNSKKVLADCQPDEDLNVYVRGFVEVPETFDTFFGPPDVE